MSEHFTGMLLFFCMIHYDLSFSDISTVSYNSSEEIKNIFSFFHANDSVLKGAAITGNFAEGGLINNSLSQFGLEASIKHSAKNLTNHHRHVSEFVNLLNGKNISSSINNATTNISYNSFQTTSTKALLATKLIETGSNLFLGVPEVIHINGTSSIKPRKGVHYSKIVPRKGVDNENEAIHLSSGNESCFWLSEKECYINKGMQDLQCTCCREGNILGKNVRQTPVSCKSCKTFNILSSKGNQTCKNICCNAINHNFNSLLSTQNIYSNYLNHQTAPSTEKRHQDSYFTEVSQKVMFENVSPKNIVTKKNNLASFKKNYTFKPDITKVPYDAESMTELLGKTQQKVFIPLAVSLFLLPLMGIIIFFLWQRVKEYWNKRCYKRMDFLIDGIYND